MSDRVRFIPNPAGPDPVLLINLAEFSAPLAALEFIAEARELVGTQPQHSVCCMVDVSGSRFNTAVVEALKELAAHDKPYIIASALIGVTGLQRIILESVIKFTGRKNMKSIATRDEGFVWIADQRAGVNAAA